MTSTTATPEAPAADNASKTANLVAAAETNEWGQITGLEPHTTYFVIRKPTAEMGREKRKQAVADIRAFLEKNRIVTEEQMKRIDEKYVSPGKEKAKEVRETLEKRFDEIAKEVEARFEKLEQEWNARAPKAFRNAKGEGKATTVTTTVETPGEMPTGEHDEPAPASGSEGAAKGKKPSGKKTSSG